MLKKSGEKFEFPVEYGLNLQSEHERWLTEKHFKCPVTVFKLSKGDQALLHAVER
jgi:asparaginyl-tRNA synthetase